jgi:hypothetical protein
MHTSNPEARITLRSNVVSPSRNVHREIVSVHRTLLPWVRHKLDLLLHPVRTQGQIIGEDKSQSKHLKYDVPAAAGKQRFRRRCSTTWLEWTMMRCIRSFVIGYKCNYPVESPCMCNICFENPDCASPAAVVRDLASKFLKACGTHSQCLCR